MTFRELPEYCKNHMCKSFVMDCKERECKYQGLCTRFVHKYGITPIAYLKKERLAKVKNEKTI